MLELSQKTIQCVLLLGLLQLADQLRRREEPYSKTCPTRGLTQRDGDVSFSSSVAPYKTTIILVFNPFTACQLQDLWLRELWYQAEVVGLEVLQDREFRVLDPGRDCVGGRVASSISVSRSRNWK